MNTHRIAWSPNLRVSASPCLRVLLPATRHPPPAARVCLRVPASFFALAGLLTIGLVARAAAHPHHAAQQEEVDAAAEAAIHTPAGFEHEGTPSVAEGANTALLEATIVDRATGEPAPCRVNVVGSDGNYYEPENFDLAPWSLHRTGNRPGKGPFRYYGWFFYTTGTFQVRVPPGPVRIEVWKGYEFRPVEYVLAAEAGHVHQVEVEIERTVPMAERGYYSGDTHIHLNRHTPADDERALDLLAAEDIAYGFLLCMNDPRTYTGAMARQEWPQEGGFGPTSVYSRGEYLLASGQEYRCGTYGHICFLMHSRLVLDGLTVDPNNWPVFGLVAQEVRDLGGYSFHAHGGYSQEIFADFAQQATDAVELLQFAQYRGVSLEGWYKMLSVGYQFPGVGASDYPYCRALGDCRTYVYADEKPEAKEWTRLAALGRGFFTTGPLLLLEVNERRPGDTLALTGAGPHAVSVRVRVRSEVAPIQVVEIVMGGKTVAQLTPPSAVQGGWLTLTQELEVAEPTWIAARASSVSSDGRPNAEAHANPVYVRVDGRAPFSGLDRDWLVERLDERIAELERREFPEQEQALEYFNRSRDILMKLPPL